MDEEQRSDRLPKDDTDKNLAVSQSQDPAVPQNKNIFQSAKDFFDNAVSAVKGKDLNQVVEDFTAEMTLVAEGLSEDQEKLTIAQNDLSVQQTLDKEETRKEFQEMEKQLLEMKQHVERVEKSIAQFGKQLTEKKEKKRDGVKGILQQVTRIVAVAGGAWVIVTVIQLIGSLISH